MTKSGIQELPAILGGEPIRPDGPPPWPPAWPEVAAALEQSLRDQTWGLYQGPNYRRLAEELAAYHQVEFVELCASGTFAIELALRAVPIGPGDEVILAAYDFPGNYNDIVAVGAHPVLIDVAASNWQLDPEELAETISPATKAILVSHLHGGVVPMQAVIEVARAHGLVVIEDACQMPGAMIEGRRAGTWGDVGVISFGGSKLLSAGRGGALLTSAPAIKQRAQVYCNRGNHAYPLSELQATVLRPQLARLDERNQTRTVQVALLIERLADVPGFRSLPNILAATAPGYYKLGFQYKAQEFGGLKRAKFVAAARAEGIDFNVGFRAFQYTRSPRRFRQVGSLTNATAADAQMVILHHPVLLAGADAMEQVARCVARLHHWGATIEQAPDESLKLPSPEVG